MAKHFHCSFWQANSLFDFKLFHQLESEDMTTLTVETLTSLIAQLEAKRNETGGHLPSTENSVTTSSDDSIDHDELGNLGGSVLLSTFTPEDLLQKRKKNDTATEAQQTFCVSIFNSAAFKVIQRCHSAVGIQNGAQIICWVQFPVLPFL